MINASGFSLVPATLSVFKNFDIFALVAHSDFSPSDKILSIQRVIHIACKDRFQAAKFANGIACAFDLAFSLIAAVPGYPHSGFSDCGPYIAFVVVEQDVTVVFVVECYFCAFRLGTEIFGIAENSLRVGTVAWKLQLHSAGLAKPILNVAAPGINCLRAAERNCLH